MQGTKNWVNEKRFNIFSDEKNIICHNTKEKFPLEPNVQRELVHTYQ
jgi:hypothetical protein